MGPGDLSAIARDGLFALFAFATPYGWLFSAPTYLLVNSLLYPSRKPALYDATSSSWVVLFVTGGVLFAAYVCVAVAARLWRERRGAPRKRPDVDSRRIRPADEARAGELDSWRTKTIWEYVTGSAAADSSPRTPTPAESPSKKAAPRRPQTPDTGAIKRQTGPVDGSEHDPQKHPASRDEGGTPRPPTTGGTPRTVRRETTSESSEPSFWLVGMLDRALLPELTSATEVAVNVEGDGPSVGDYAFVWSRPLGDGRAAIVGYGRVIDVTGQRDGGRYAIGLTILDPLTASPHTSPLLDRILTDAGSGVYTERLDHGDGRELLAPVFKAREHGGRPTAPAPPPKEEVPEAGGARPSEANGDDENGSRHPPFAPPTSRPASGPAPTPPRPSRSPPQPLPERPRPAPPSAGALFGTPALPRSSPAPEPPPRREPHPEKRPPSAGPSLAARRSQGRGLPAPARRAIEEHAMARARARYEAEGYSVYNVSQSESYDLRCERGGRELHVEVKGTTGSPDSVLITANEERHAREQFPNIDLFVVYGIGLRGKHSPTPLASGGTVRLLSPWDIGACRVETVTARCHLPPELEKGGQLPLTFAAPR